VCIDAIPAFSSNSCSRQKFQQELSQKITTTQQKKKKKTFISNLKKRKKKKKKQNYKAANFFVFYCIDKRKRASTNHLPGSWLSKTKKCLIDQGECKDDKHERNMRRTTHFAAAC
jgi:hypothetical protein